jgi:hypothetical protein
MPRRPTNILHVRVRSPRLAWLGLLGILGRFVKLGFLAAVLTAIGWAGYKGYQRVVLENPDFQLRVIDLNPNPVLDEPAFVSLTGLDLQTNLTQIDTTAMRETLLAHPAITAARIERHLPDTLVVRISTREPRAWIAMPDAGHPIRREAGAMLIDGGRIPYPCPELQFEAASSLPVIVLKPEPEQPLTPGTPMRNATLAPCLRLLDNINRHTPGLLATIDTLDQPTPWSIRAVTRSGTEATFGLHGHDRQLRRLDSALAHTSATGRPLATINLIPRENIPVTFRPDAPPPREAPAPTAVEPPIPVAIPVDEADLDESRRAGDLDAILHRN